jgi:hypothetical protein
VVAASDFLSCSRTSGMSSAPKLDDCGGDYEPSLWSCRPYGTLA